MNSPRLYARCYVARSCLESAKPAEYYALLPTLKLREKLDKPTLRFQQNLVFQSVGAREATHVAAIEGHPVDHVAHEPLHDLAHLTLLEQRTVDLQRNYQRVLRPIESILRNRLDDVQELQLRCQCVTMVHNRIAVAAIPAIDLNAPTTTSQRINVLLRRTLTHQLMGAQVGVV
jgi:hypothetical protein